MKTARVKVGLPLLVVLLISVTLLLGVVFVSNRHSNSNGSNTDNSSNNNSGSNARAKTRQEQTSPPSNSNGEEKQQPVAQATTSITRRTVPRLTCPKQGAESFEFTLADIIEASRTSTTSSKTSSNPLLDSQAQSQQQQGSKRNSSSTKGDGPITHWVELVQSSPGTLCTLVQVSNTTSNTQQQQRFILPMARSYAGHPWEVAAGTYASTLNEIECHKYDHDNGGGGRVAVCRLNLGVAAAALENDITDTTDPSKVIFQLTTFGQPSYLEQDTIARFLEQTTFGQTMDEIHRIQMAPSIGTVTSTTTPTLSTKFATWIQEQMDVTRMPIMSHREIYRRRVNARFEVASPIGAVTQPCSAGTRYRRTAFTEKDIAKDLEILRVNVVDGDNVDGDGSSTNTTKIRISVNGQLRTIVDDPLYRWDPELNQPVQQDWADGAYYICWVYYDGERTGLSVTHPDYDGDCILILFSDLNANHDMWWTGGQLWTNPPIAIPSKAETDWTVLEIPLEAAQVIDAPYFPFPNEVPEDLEIILLADLDSAGCDALGPMGISREEPPVFAVWNYSYYIHDPRFQLLDNSIENPLQDGGGTAADRYGNVLNYEFSTICANTPRSFLNEDTCYLSDHPNVCRFRTASDEERDIPEALFEVSHENLRAIYEATGAGIGNGTVYLYAVDGLDITRDPFVSSPCEPGTLSRWISVPCSDRNNQVSPGTAALLGEIMSWSEEENENPKVLDIWHPERLARSCAQQDMTAKGFEINRDSSCYLNVHPDHLGVFSFTYWAKAHPGNSANRNPIKEVAESGSTTLVFPEWHELSRWQNIKDEFPGGIRLGDYANFYALPIQLRTQEIADALGIELVRPGDNNDGEAAGRTLVCGSPFEVANDPFLGGSAGRGAFDAATVFFQSSQFEELGKQRTAAWTMAALEDPGQLRQRVAWALSQILVISPASIDEGDVLTEAFLVFYDIMVRNAFGNYRDILKEVSFSPMMADMLTYYGGRSTSVVWAHEGNLEYADENYAREIMQLFTTGLFKLHLNGTEVMNSEGRHERVYTNDDIEEYARAWTGFVSQEARGNVEYTYTNRIDPMRIREDWRDRLPKMGLDRTYIGDGYPMCSDLPTRHFLAKGAVYRLLGSIMSPELQRDPVEWSNTSKVERLSLQPVSLLHTKLCGSSDGDNCQFAAKIVLAEALSCSGVECTIDTVRSVEVAGVFYEYQRPPCVHHAFYNDAKTIAPRWDWKNIIMCGDPRMESGSAACCDDGNDWSLFKWDDKYFGERTFFSTALDRCSQSLCSSGRRPSCDDEDDAIGTRCYDNHYFWTAEPCSLKVKIDKDSGKVGIVHEPAGIDRNITASVVNLDTKTFFRVDWIGDYKEVASSCGNMGVCVETEDNMCLCEVSVTDERVFDKAPSSREEILANLHIGAFKQKEGPVISPSEGVKIYNLGVDGSLTSQSIFEVVDRMGIPRWRRNVKSSVSIVGSDISFRNPVHFASLSDPEPRDAHYETDATIDHYINHKNTAPFLAIRFAQRFGTSNPSPRYVQEIATAFVTGSYTFGDGTSSEVFGTGEYGDLASTLACVLLDREARDVLLDFDPAHGALKEPFIKVLSVMRAFKFQPKDGHRWVEFARNLGGKIGQAPHRIPNVFSFFLPEYQPAGPVSQGDLVSPEAQVLTGPRVINTLNGIFSLIKYGLNHCFGGFGREDFDECDDNLGKLTYEPSSESLDERVSALATLMTAGRLGQEGRRLVETVLQEGEEFASLKKAQILIATTPEFHSTNLVHKSGEKRVQIAPPTASTKPYRALVYVLLQGGVDSFNMLAPHTCAGVNADGLTLLEQYKAERTSIAMRDEERTRIIDADGQPCTQFAIHQGLSIVETLYNDGDLAFFANVGQIDAPVTKSDYYSVTQTVLFAHNTMQQEAQRIDPWKVAPGTGVLGRMCDALLGLDYSCQSVTVQDATVATVGGIPGASFSPLIVSPEGLSKFAPTKEGETFDIGMVAELNNATSLHSSVFGETWSRTLQKAIADADKLTDALGDIHLTQDYPEEAEGEYVGKIKALSSMILTRQARGADRDVFFLKLGDWDHHEALQTSLSREFQGLNQAFTLFEQEMKAHGLWDQVTTAVTSDFARTLTANSGEGSDHAWGGNYFMFGGSVKGGTIHGEYPADITLSGPLNIGRGRLIPTSSWESVLTSAVQWMGIQSEKDLDMCLPNRVRTGTKIFGMDDVFQEANRTQTRLRRG